MSNTTSRVCGVHLQYLSLYTERRHWRNCWFLYDRQSPSALWRMHDYFSAATPRQLCIRLRFIRAKNRRKYSPGRHAGRQAAGLLVGGRVNHDRYYWLHAFDRQTQRIFSTWRIHQLPCSGVHHHRLHHFPAAAAAAAAQTYFSSQINFSSSYFGC